MPVYVGCDLGTMGSKAAVVDEDGRLCGEAFEEVPLDRPRAGWVEQDPLLLEASAHRVIRRALAASERRDVAAVAFSGQMSGIGTIDENFAPATHYDSWLDTRCEPYIAQMAHAADRVVERSGCPPTYSHGPKILWWQHERPETFERIRRFLPIGSFVVARAAGLSVDEAFVDHTYLHFSNLADTQAGTWSAELIATFGVDPSVLPRIVAPTDVIGTVTHAAAEATGPPVGTPVAAGAGDTTAASLGAGAVRPGRAFDAAGTASVLAICLDGFHPDRAGHTLMAPHAASFPAPTSTSPSSTGEAWRCGGSGTRSRATVRPAPTPDWTPSPRRCHPAPRACCGTRLQGRVLPPSPHARASWVGLTSRHGRGHLYRAMLEGIALEYAEWARPAAVAGGSPLYEARVLGGGAGSAVWNQIKADVLGIDWVPTLVQEAGVLGDALVAAAAVGHVTDMAATVEAWQGTAEPFRPRPAAHARYKDLQPAYRRMSESLRPVFEVLGQTKEEL